MDKAVRSVLDANSDLEMLGFDSKATPAANGVNHKFRELSRTVHPDKNKHPDASQAFQKLSAAKDRLLQEIQKREAAEEAKKRARAAAAASRPAAAAPPRPPVEAPTVPLPFGVKLPPGWYAKRHTRQGGKDAGQFYHTYHHPTLNGQFRSLTAVNQYLAQLAGPAVVTPRQTPYEQRYAANKQQQKGIPRAKKGAAAAAPPVEEYQPQRS